MPNRRLALPLAQVEDAVIEVAAVEQPAQVHEVAVVAGPIERLVERREALLPVEHEVRGRMAVEGGRAGDLARCEEEAALVLDAKQATGRVVLEDALDEFLGGARVPDESRAGNQAVPLPGCGCCREGTGASRNSDRRCVPKSPSLALFAGRANRRLRQALPAAAELVLGQVDQLVRHARLRGRGAFVFTEVTSLSCPPRGLVC